MQGHSYNKLCLRAAGQGTPPPTPTHHEEVEAGEGDEVDRQLAQVGVQLAGEPQAAGDACGG